MLDRNSFMETLREVAEIIRTSATPLSREEILSYFKDMELTDEQKNMVFEYLLTPHEEENNQQEEVEDEAEAVEVKTDSEDYMPTGKTFQMYLEDITNLPLYTENEYEDMYRRLLGGEQELVKVLSDSWLCKVLEMAKKYASPKYNLEDVIQEGNIGLFIKLGELCGCNEAIDVESELTEAVDNAMKTYISQVTGEDDSENTVLGKVNLINEAIKYLSDKNGHEPSISELSEYTKMEPEELADITKIIEDAEKKSK